MVVIVIVVVVHTCLFQGELSAAASEKADVAAELSGVQHAVSESEAAKAALEQEVASLRDARIALELQLVETKVCG
jgi:hypothetical protein